MMTRIESIAGLRWFCLLVMSSVLGGCALYEELEPIDPEAATVDSVEISPASASLQVGDTLQLSATVRGPNGDVIEGRAVEWSSSNDSRALVSQDGLVEGLAVGVVEVRARAGGVSGMSQIEVVVPVAEVVLEPAEVTLDVGQTRQLDARVLDTEGGEVDSAVVEWTSSQLGVVSVDSSGLVEGLTEGSSTVSASYAGKVATAVVNVEASVASVEVSPNPAQVGLGETVSLEASALDSNGNRLTGRDAVWASSDDSVATVNAAGLVTGVAEGSVDITATIEGREGVARVQVTRPVVSVTVTPDPLRLDLADSGVLTAIARDAEGADLQLSADAFSWRTSDPGVAGVDGSGAVEALGEGSAEVTAEVNGVSDSARVEVSRPVVDLRVTPSDVSVGVSQTAQLSATLLDANGNVITGRSVNWLSTDSNVATVDASGVVRGERAGDATVEARIDGLVASAQVTVTTSVATVAVSPDGGAIDVGEFLQLSAAVEDANGNTLAEPVTWTSSDDQIATVDATGKVLGVSDGAVQVTAAAGGESDTVVVTVNSVVASVSVTPNPLTLFRGTTQVLDANLQDSSGATVSGRVVTWSSNNVNVATVDSSGLLTATGVGVTTVAASSEGVTGSTTVTVIAPVASIEITPDPVSLDLNDMVSLTATLRDSSGNALTGRTVVWDSSDDAVATVNGQGEVSSVAEGVATVSATSEGISASVTVTVSAAVASVVVTPPSARIWADEAAQLAAEAFDNQGGTLNRPVTWTSSDTSVATVDAAGLVTAVAPGVTAISAEVEGVSEDVEITVVEWMQVTAGQRFTCGLLTDGEAYCWGENDTGESGTGLVGGTNTEPKRVLTSERFTELEAASLHVCGLTVNEEMYCWGNGNNGALGYGLPAGSTIPEDKATPVKVSGAYTWKELAPGVNHTCGVDDSQDVYCWGINQQGQLGNGTGFDAVVPQLVSGGRTFVDAASGQAHTCGLTDVGEIYCWGLNDEGQLGTGDTVNLPTPTTSVASTQVFVAVSAGNKHTCGLTNSGDVYCWGSNLRGQLAVDPATVASDPDPRLVTVAGETFESIEMGQGYSCGTTTSGRIYCWGFNGQANFGNGFPSVEQPTPVMTSGGYSWLQVGAGLQHTCGINGQVDAFCWGDNDNGEVGIATTSNIVASPTAVKRPTL